MSGRSRPRTAKSPDFRTKEMKHALKEEKQKKIPKTTKTRDLQKSKHAEEKPPVEETAEEKGAKHLTWGSNEDLRMPTERKITKTCSNRSKSMRKAQEDRLDAQLEIKTTITLPETPKKFSQASLEAPEPQASSQAESQTNSVKVAAKIQGEQLEKAGPRRTSAKNNKAAAEKFNNEECADKDAQKMPKAKADSVLRDTLDKLKIKKKDQSETSKVVNDFIENLRKYLKAETVCFKEVEEPLRTGSYYENLKISDPDEFDIMLPMPVERVDIKPFGTDGAFYTVALKRGGSPLLKFQQNEVLSASEMLKEFREAVKKFAKKFPDPEWKMEPKKRGCPAVTLTREVASATISLDVVLCLKVKSSWPSFTKDGFKIEPWLGTKVKQEYKWEPYYLVPKYEGSGNVESNGVQAKDAWRVSFSHVEKDIMKKHGSEKTCCEKKGASCCRKGCLKLLKHLLHLLKESNSSFDKFCSYHAKTTFLHACCSRTKDGEWEASLLGRCFNLLLQDFEGHLRHRKLQNFFIPGQNLLSALPMKVCSDLADSIRKERENGFPIFVKYLDNPH
uniref:Cyclic GMP-AMP synthase n=1 Tax=Fundulus heteroclitus TaxID=8078 RepID=A0A3Q2PBB4_FUNHE